jgi:exopolyphosphatase/guanosine-5'-triphosphate,3'-diphosphate pyrophosphatase
MILAIIDIGSNAVRSVIYSDNSIAAYELYHERFKIDLTNLGTSLEWPCKHPLNAIMHRFIDMFHKLKVSEIKCVATAVLRDNPAAELFCKMFYEKYKINIEIISGQQEAFLSSCGLLMGSPNPHGIIADLGGGSLEIAQVHSHKISELTSLPIGTQILNTVANLDINYITEKIRQLYQKPQAAKLYLIGGGFRLIAKSYIAHAQYPLYNIHNLEIARSEIDEYLNYLERDTNAIFKSTRSNDRYSILVLKGLIEVFQPATILVSNYGLKEGIRYTTLPQEERYKDVVFERCKAFSGCGEDEIDLEGYTAVIGSILSMSENYSDEVGDIIKIALLFMRFKKNVDRNFFGHFISHAILMSDIPFTHKQRASLAFITSCAFGNKANHYTQQMALKVLKSNEYKTAMIIAKIINIAMLLDGPDLSRKCSFTIGCESSKLFMKTAQTLPFNIYMYVNRQLKAIAKLGNK